MAQPIYMPDYGGNRAAQGQQAFLQAMQMRQRQEEWERQRQHQMEYLEKSNAYNVRAAQNKAIADLFIQGTKDNRMDSRATEKANRDETNIHLKAEHDEELARLNAGIGEKGVKTYLSTDDNGKQVGIKIHPDGNVKVVPVPGNTGKSRTGTTEFDNPDAASTRKFDELTVSTQNALDMSNTIIEDIKKNPTITGFSGFAQRKLASWVTQAKNTAKIAGGTAEINGHKISDEKFMQHYMKKSTWDNLKISAGQSTAMKASLVRLAYSIARSMEPGGRLTDQDFNRALEQLAGKTGDPAQMEAAIQRTMKNSVSNYKNSYRVHHRGKETDLSELNLYGFGGSTQPPPPPQNKGGGVDLNQFMTGQ